MILFKFFLLALFLTGCATQGEKLRVRLSNYPDQKILDIPFYQQEAFHCGPAALAMISNNLGLQTSPNELSKMLYSPESKGTFQNDLIGATRRLGFIAIPTENLEQIIHEINDGNPILVFQNLGLTWIPKWHYAVVTGYDLKNNEILLHTGEYQNYRMSLNTFENTWKRVDRWGLIIVKSGSIPNSSSELEMVKATAGLELVNELDKAQVSYEKIIERWPQSLGALVGLGNVYFQKKDYLRALEYLKTAIEAHPQSLGARNNYALAYKAYLEAGNKKKRAVKTLKN